MNRRKFLKSFYINIPILLFFFNFKSIELFKKKKIKLHDNYHWYLNSND